MTSLVNTSSQGAIRGSFVKQNSMESRMVRNHTDNRQFCPSTEKKGKEMNRLGSLAGPEKARLDHGELINNENGGCFNPKPEKYLDETQCHVSPDFLLVNTAERRSCAEVSISQNSCPQPILLQKPSTPYFTALEKFSDWLYEWTPPERIPPKLKMIGQMRNEIVQGWLLSVNIQRPLPLYEPKKRKTLDRKDASVQTDGNLRETPSKTRHKFTWVKRWLQNCLRRSQHSCRTTLCTGGERDMEGESQKNVDALKYNKSGYSTVGEKCSRQEAVTMATLKDPGCIDDITRSSKNSDFADTPDSTQNKVKLVEKSSDIKYSSSNTDFMEQDAQSTATMVDKNLCNLRVIDVPSLVCTNEIIKLTEDGETDRKYWQGAKVNEPISPRSVGTEAGDNIESDLKTNQIDFQSKTAPRLTASSHFEEVEKIDDDIGRDSNEEEKVELNVGLKRKIYSTEAVRKITAKENLSSANNKIIFKLEKARVNLLNMSRSFRSKIKEMDSPSIADGKVKTTEIRSLPVRLFPESSDDAPATKFCAQRRSIKVHPKPLKVHLGGTINEMNAESLDRAELQGMTDFIETMLQRDKTTNPNIEINGLLQRQRELNTRMTNPSTFLPCHRLELAFRETLRQKFAHHNHFRTNPLPLRPDPRQGCIGCQLVVSSELYGNSQKLNKT